MSITITCRTRFDITATGVRNHYKKERAPFQRENGEIITDREHWDRARNQQRNWETINQIISLRCLPERISEPRRDRDVWWFQFDVTTPAAIADNHDPVAFLKSDAQDVPMLVGLDETPGLPALLNTQGADANIWFVLSMDK